MDQLEYHDHPRFMRQASLSACRTMTHGCEGALDGIAGADVLPMLGREIVERQQRLAILGQAISGFIVFGLVLGKKAIEGFLGLVAAFGHPCFLEIRLRFGLNRFRHFVEHIHGFVDPAPLLPG